jgi:hypothetical protein
MAFKAVLFAFRRLVRSAALRRCLRIGPIAVVHAAGLFTLYATELDLVGQGLFLLTWGLLNCAFILVLRRPLLAGLVSLGIVQLVVAVSQFKFEITWMTITFLDLLIIDPDSIAFLLGRFPDLRIALAAGGLLALPLAVLLWFVDPLRIRARTAAAACVACLAGLFGLSIVVPEQPWEPFQGVNHVSNFARSAVLTLSELTTKGWIEFDSAKAAPLHGLAEETCVPTGKRPHIVMVLDESSFDISSAPGIKVPPGYERHFRSLDGNKRTLITEATGGPTWYTEYNVLTGLSARSFGRLMFYVTRIAAGRVRRGLPQALRGCGYKTFSLYPAYGAFLGARGFQNSAGVERLIDAKEMGARDVEPDRFYYDQAAQLIGRQRGEQPLFLFVYTVANHFPWTTAYRPDLTPHWHALGNAPEVEEYVRRQAMSAQDYTAFVARLRQEFPDESFLVVRFGDHPPSIAHRLIEPSAPDAEVARRVMQQDPRYYSTYYAVDAVNFQPSDLSSALAELDAAYLPLVVLEAAGLPLDASFREQKAILQRCNGRFYRCAGGAEARRFNRLLIDAGLIKGM